VEQPILTSSAVNLEHYWKLTSCGQSSGCCEEAQTNRQHLTGCWQNGDCCSAQPVAALTWTGLWSAVLHTQHDTAPSTGCCWSCREWFWTGNVRLPHFLDTTDGWRGFLHRQREPGPSVVCKWMCSMVFWQDIVHPLCLPWPFYRKERHLYLFVLPE